MEANDLWVELKPDRPSYMVLKGTYGQKIHSTFRMTRQGVRWRFWRLFNDIYVSAFETILFIEQAFGTQLRDHAIRISKERYALRQEIRQSSFQPADQVCPRPRKTNDTRDRRGDRSPWAGLRDRPAPRAAAPGADAHRPQARLLDQPPGSGYRPPATRSDAAASPMALDRARGRPARDRPPGRGLRLRQRVAAP